MIITCVECGTQFYLENKMLAPTGRKVQCSQCKSVWFQEYRKPPKVKLDNLTSLSKDKIFLPAVIERKKSWIWLIVMSVLLFTALSLGIILYPASSDDQLGLLSVDDLEVSALELAYKKNGQLDINITVANNKDLCGRVPPMTITLLDENRKNIKSISMPASPKYLNKGEKYSFYRRIKNHFKARPKFVSVKLIAGTEAAFYNSDLG